MLDAWYKLSKIHIRKHGYQNGKWEVEDSEYDFKASGQFTLSSSDNGNYCYDTLRSKCYRVKDYKNEFYKYCNLPRNFEYIRIWSGWRHQQYFGAS